MCVTLRKKDTNKYTFSLQWHITSKCDQKCKHCYMYNSESYASEVTNELDFKQCTQIVDDYLGILSKWNVGGSLIFGGGDPLLRQDFFDILKYVRDKNKSIILAVMGNSFHVNEKIAHSLKENGIALYQISLDGMEKTHDLMRKPGSFKDAIRAYKILKRAEISTACMFTVSKRNMDELIDVINLCAEYEIDAFDFDRLVPVGNGDNLRNEIIPAHQYKELLYKVKEKYELLKKQGCKTQFGYKDNLWNLIIDEREWEFPIPNLPSGFELVRGCSIGNAGFAVLADGSVMACRRLPIIIGKLPDEKLEEIYINSSQLNIIKKSLDNRKIDCNGCRAVAYGYSQGDIFSRDPQSWA